MGFWCLATITVGRCLRSEHWGLPLMWEQRKQGSTVGTLDCTRVLACVCVCVCLFVVSFFLCFLFWFWFGCLFVGRVGGKQPSSPQSPSNSTAQQNVSLPQVCEIREDAVAPALEFLADTTPQVTTAQRWEAAATAADQALWTKACSPCCYLPGGKLRWLTRSRSIISGLLHHGGPGERGGTRRRHAIVERRHDLWERQCERDEEGCRVSEIREGREGIGLAASLLF